MESCILIEGAGTHGSIHGYEFEESKETIQTLLEQMTISRPDLQFIPNDTDIQYDLLVRTENSRVFVYRFAGDEDYWEEHPESCSLFLAYTKLETEKTFKKDQELTRAEKKEVISIFRTLVIDSLLVNHQVRLIIDK
jgi:hypothetical protein